MRAAYTDEMAARLSDASLVQILSYSERMAQQAAEGGDSREFHAQNARAKWASNHLWLRKLDSLGNPLSGDELKSRNRWWIPLVIVMTLLMALALTPTILTFIS